MSLVQDLMIDSKKNQKDCKDLQDKLSSLSDQIQEVSRLILTCEIKYPLLHIFLY